MLHRTAAPIPESVDNPDTKSKGEDTMSDLSAPAENQQGDIPQYTETGPNETLRIDGVSYIYDPEYNLWLGEMNDALTATEIHDMIIEGVHRVFPWTPLEAEVER
jgi:hypothetical protein